VRLEGLGKLEKKNVYIYIYIHTYIHTVDSQLSARGLTALRLNRGNAFLKK
jgi:hypothetical protein